ncbi:hypothetical protein DFH09DRAFT_1027357 [Mycena vulgaris]|nr:hypothetical protein DFH09DRAFT_1027357 [Mycena vulgaris]
MSYAPKYTPREGQGKASLDAQIAPFEDITEPDALADAEAASTKLWSVYVGEAEKYDKGLVESWRGDMAVMLIFAGLFSASLTAFLVESYRTLTPDSGDITVILLNQISQQLAAAANGNNFTVPVHPPFKPRATSLVCNALWFISLGLSLMCALTATLLEQWARDFIQRSDMRSAPLVRARVFSYLYFGLKRFNMHTVVMIIPLLLHASLLFFLAGLVAFLVPVNRTMMFVALSLLGVFATMYGILTVLPLVHLDCPYRTPLSGVLWHLTGRLLAVWSHSRPQVITRDAETMVEATFRQAAAPSEERLARDQKALIWTAKSLAEDIELEPFIDALPDVIDASCDRHHGYVDHIRRLISHPEVRLLERIEHLLRGCSRGMLTLDVQNRREIVCYKALWALASVEGVVTSGRQNVAHIPRSSISPGIRWLDSESDIRRHYIPCRALLEWSALTAAHKDHEELLKKCRKDIRGGSLPHLESALTYINQRATTIQWDVMGVVNVPFPLLKQELAAYTEYPRVESAWSLVAGLEKGVQVYYQQVFLRILCDYLEACATDINLSHPYRFSETIRILESSTSPSPIPLALRWRLVRTLDTLVFGPIEKISTSPDIHWIDLAIHMLLAHWATSDEIDFHLLTLPRGVIHYLNHRGSPARIAHIMSAPPSELLHCIPATLLLGVTRPHARETDATEIVGFAGCLEAVWHLYMSCHTRLAALDPCVHQPILDTIINQGSSSGSPSVVAIIKSVILHHLKHKKRDLPLDSLNALAVFHLLPETLVKVPPEILADGTAPDALSTLCDERIIESKLLVLTEFLESCLSANLPFRAVDTVERLGAFNPHSAIHAPHQLRFAVVLKRLFDRTEADVKHAFINLQVFDVYISNQNTKTWPTQEPCHPWLDCTEARQNIRDALSTYLGTVSLTNHPQIVTRLTKMLAHLEAFHRDEL